MGGDDLMGNDLYAYMKARSDKIAEKDVNKQKILAIQKELYQKKGINYNIQLWKISAARNKEVNRMNKN